jgi:hypothetical protein
MALREGRFLRLGHHRVLNPRDRKLWASVAPSTRSRLSIWFHIGPYTTARSETGPRLHPVAWHFRLSDIAATNFGTIETAKNEPGLWV